MKKGLYAKYLVFKRNGEKYVPIEKDVFVIAFDDKHAQAALLAYASSCEQDNPELAQDLINRFKP